MIELCCEYLSVWCIDCVFLSYHNITYMFRVNRYSIIAWMSRNSLLETSAILNFRWLQWESNPDRLDPQQALNYLVKLAKWLNCVVGNIWKVHWLCIFIVPNAHYNECTYYTQHAIITLWSVWVNSWLFIYKLSGCRFQSRCIT